MCDLHACGVQENLPPPVVTDAERRAFVKGMISLPLASVLFYPELAAAQAAQVTRHNIPLDGGGAVFYAYAKPMATKSAPVVILVHEWWGLNDQILAVAQEFANLGYHALAVDLYDGKVAKSPDEALQLMQNIDAIKASWQMEALITAARTLPGSNGKIGTVGWCFGGGWSLNGSLAAPVDATVVYYGNVRKSAAELAPLQGPVLGHFGRLDKSINQAMVAGFEAEMKRAGKQFITYWYDADHAFANPTGARYDSTAAKLAWERTLAFYAQNLQANHG